LTTRLYKSGSLPECDVSGFGFITVEGRELAGDAAADRMRRLVVGDWVTDEDLTGSYPSPVSSTPTAFTLLAGSSNQVATIGSSLGNYCSSNCPTA
jgi:hypothetical protein